MGERYVVIQDKDSRPGLVHVRRGFREEVGEMKTREEEEKRKKDEEAKRGCLYHCELRCHCADLDTIAGFLYRCEFPGSFVVRRLTGSGAATTRRPPGSPHVCELQTRSLMTCRRTLINNPSTEAAK